MFWYLIESRWFGYKNRFIFSSVCSCKNISISCRTMVMYNILQSNFDPEIKDLCHRLGRWQKTLVVLNFPESIWLEFSQSFHVYTFSNLFPLSSSVLSPLHNVLDAENYSYFFTLFPIYFVAIKNIMVTDCFSDLHFFPEVYAFLLSLDLENWTLMITYRLTCGVFVGRDLLFNSIKLLHLRLECIYVYMTVSSG